jgi:hypothetical protein
MKEERVSICRNLRRQKCDKEESKKILKYKDLAIEMKRQWNVAANMLPVITGQLEPSQNHSENT